jgi:hypothetical protein
LEQKPLIADASSLTTHIYHLQLPRGYFLHLYPFSQFHSWSPGWIGIIVLFGAYLPSIEKSCLKLNDAGIEFEIYPKPSIKIGWHEVLRLERGTLFGSIPFDKLYIDRPPLGSASWVVWSGNREWVAQQRQFIPLNNFVGWPDGELAADLRRYIPQIISTQT